MTANTQIVVSSLRVATEKGALEEQERTTRARQGPYQSKQPAPAGFLVLELWGYRIT